jgi:23S rRNA (uridine2552-2'-O)-methyltransferase
MGRSKSSGQWLQEHFQDEYVKQAQTLGYRSRAVFKLQEIQERDKIITPDSTVIDLGAAPGGWSQYAREIVGKKHKVIALDILDIEPLEGVEFIQGDFREAAVMEQLLEVLQGIPVNLILSDMAPNMSGSKEVDQPRAIYLAELALETAKEVLGKGGTFLVKLFQGEGFDAYHQEVKRSFNQVMIRKPKASRARSSEVYLLGKNFKA